MDVIYNIKALSGLHRHHQWDDANNFHHALHVIREHMQTHFRRYVLECSHQKVLGAHPEFDGAKGMLHGLTTYTHRFREVNEPVLHFI